MRKIIGFICACTLLFALAGCSASTAKDAVITLGDSQKFSEAELQAAVTCVKSTFKDFEGCTLQALWYDEEYSEKHIEGYMQNGRGSKNGIAAENVIVLQSDFYVDDSGRAGGFNPDSDYTDWNWILIRDSKTAAWRADDWGY